MDYQEKLEKIKSMSEEQLRKDVLIPLFVAMGCQNVKEYHGTADPPPAINPIPFSFILPFLIKNPALAYLTA